MLEEHQWMGFLALGLAAALTLGCGGGWEEQTETDQGTVCLYDSAAKASASFPNPTAEQNYSADQPVHVHFEPENRCLSSSCDRNGSAQCSVTVEGNTIRITTSAKWEHDEGASSCTDDCRILQATCASAALPSGDYLAIYGAFSDDLAVPSTSPALCLP